MLSEAKDLKRERCPYLSAAVSLLPSNPQVHSQIPIQTPVQVQHYQSLPHSHFWKVLHLH
jgi:hypothetical protein